MSVARIGPPVPVGDEDCHISSVGERHRIMSSVNAFNDEGLLSCSMPSLDDNDGRTCVVNDAAAMMTDNNKKRDRIRPVLTPCVYGLCVPKRSHCQ